MLQFLLMCSQVLCGSDRRFKIGKQLNLFSVNSIFTPALLNTYLNSNRSITTDRNGKLEREEEEETNRLI